MKKTTFSTKLKLNLPVFVVLFAAVALLTSCSSEYHWVKAKSADPHFAPKSDNYASVNQAPAVSEQSSEQTSGASLAVAGSTYANNAVTTSSSPEVTGNSLATASAPVNASATIEKAQAKANEIGATLSAERKAALNSDDKAVRKLAISQTVHEQLAKDARFSQLPESKKALIEKVLINRASKLANAKASNSVTPMRKTTAGFNTLLLVGLIVLLVGLLLFLVSGVVGLIFTIIGLVLAILGLVQMLS